MNKSLLLVCAIVLIGATGAYFAFAGGPQNYSLPDEPGSIPEDGLAAAAPDDLKSTGLADGKADPVDEALPEGLEAFTREVLAGEEGEVSQLVVQVWEGKKGVPAADCEVCFLDGFEGPELRDPFAQHWSDLAATRGQRFQTDAEGRVVLPGVNRWAMVTAQHAGAYGFAKVGRRHRPVETITLQPDETVTVRVVDGEDRPVAGVPVGVVQRVPVKQKRSEYRQLLAQVEQLQKYSADLKRYIQENPGSREAAQQKMAAIDARQSDVKARLAKLKGGKGRKGKGKGRPVVAAERQPPPVSVRHEVRAQRRTDDQGLAVFRHFQVYRLGAKKWWPASEHDRFQAVLRMPLSQPVAAAFAGRPVPSKVLELRLPPTGSLALRTVDLEGRPFLHPVHADLRMAVADAVPWARVHERKEQGETEILFPFVGLGIQFAAHCRLDDDDFRWNQASIAGPTNPGQRVTVDLVVAPNAGMLFGRLVDGKGKALAGVRPSFLINSNSGRLEGESVTTDGAGQFHLPYKVGKDPRPPFRLEIRKEDQVPVAGLAMGLPALPAGRIVALGDLTLDDFGAVTYGVVVDDLDRPIAGARVQLQREREVGGRQPRRRFVDEAFVVARSDEEGRFDLFGELEPGRHRLRVQARGHFPYESADLRRDQPVYPKLLRNSKLVGTLLTPPWLRSRDLQVTLTALADGTKPRRDRVHDHKGKKYIYMDWVRPGIYSVLIRVPDFPDPVLRIDGLEILPGQQGVHPRLQDLDLGAYLHRFEVTAVDGRGQPIRPKWPLIARVLRPTGEAAFVGFAWAGTSLKITSASPQLEIWPLADGYRAEQTTLVAGSSEVRFLAVPPVDLVLPGMRGLVGKTRVWVSLRRVARSPDEGLPNSLERWDSRSGKISGWFQKLQRRRGGAQLGQGDTVRIPLRDGGRFQVAAHLLGDGKRGVHNEVVDLGVVDIRLIPGSGPQRTIVKVDAERVRQSVARLAAAEAKAPARGR